MLILDACSFTMHVSIYIRIHSSADFHVNIAVDASAEMH